MELSAQNKGVFVSRHIGPDEGQIRDMLKAVGSESLEDLTRKTVPASIRLAAPLDLPAWENEHRFLREARALASGNKVLKSHIGAGYYDVVLPGVIQRNILENPGWYTAYTPYQAEIAQGRLEALINFQTAVMDLTGMEIANASLLDEGTAAAEAMSMFFALRENESAKVFFASKRCHPQTLDVLRARAEPLGIDLRIGDEAEIADGKAAGVFGMLIQYPDTFGNAADYAALVAKAHAAGIKVAAATDLLALVLLASPGSFGVDIAVGSAQRFGVPMGFGGPHAAFFATKDAFRRHMPGRIIGVTIDAHGRRAYRMALQTREQHIRRDKATSNICTSQVLLAVMAGMYAVYHGPQGLKAIASRVHALARSLEKGLASLGCKQANAAYFDTLHLSVDAAALPKLKSGALAAGRNFRYLEDGSVGISLDETTSPEDVAAIAAVFAAALGKPEAAVSAAAAGDWSRGLSLDWPAALVRKDAVLTHPVFNSHRSETEMLRYIKSLENKDLSLNTSMIALGSCTMKLNATAEMVPLTWPEFGNIHPFAPEDQTQGYRRLFADLERDLAAVTGLPGVSLQPNAGSQGEYAGLMVIRAYHKHRGEGHRNVCLIPVSAHGTNPASAVMAGLKVVLVQCDAKGNIDLADLKKQAEAHKADLNSLMATYPSTHGVFEEGIREVCDIVHGNGGQVYMDGANMNAQVGLCSPGTIGADVCHLNLHKTFCIPHGGGGPGMGPICVAAHLAPFLPGHAVVRTGGDKAIPAVSAAPWGSASILTISWAYIRMMGGKNLARATQVAILNANYMMKRLESHYPVLYVGSNGTVAHEMILDCRKFKQSAGVEVEDIAKRLMDYGFHAPTVSFPVAGTLMVEPTESESQPEMDRFCDALIAIRKEIADLESGKADRADNLLKNAPHTAAHALSDAWKHPYSREQAVYPLAWVKANKFWPSVGRLNAAFGDKNLVCSCPPIDAYA
ncbi:MAG TPA: aminomethyl-transferring glycine dehydrogenase [Fibrobacteria bacterium]|nr:aminomethyl-transferring glycine dehydrogenase [Fibrobacteria bacterium]